MIEGFWTLPSCRSWQTVSHCRVLLPHMMFDVKPTNHGSELVASYRYYPSSGNIFKCYCPSSSMFLAMYVPIFTRSSNGDQPPSSHHLQVRNHPSPGPNSADSPSRSTKANQNFSISGNVRKKHTPKNFFPKKKTQKKRHTSMSTSNDRSQTHSAATATEHKPSPRRCLARVARRAASSSSSGSIKRFWSSWWGGTNPFTRNRDMMGPLVGYFLGDFVGLNWWINDHQNGNIVGYDRTTISRYMISHL